MVGVGRGGVFGVGVGMHGGAVCECEGGRYLMLNKCKPIDCLGVCKDPLRLLRHD